MPKPILEQLKEGPVLGDGGYVYILKQRGVPMDGFTPYGILTHADAIRQLYQEFFDAGVDVIQAQTFQGTRNRLERVGMSAHYEDIHRRAVALAREVVGNDVLLAGSIGSALGSAGLAGWGLTVDDLRTLYGEECNLVAGLGVDFLICETFYTMADSLAALEAAKATGLPVMFTVSFKAKETLDDDTLPADCARQLMAAGADIIGINCMREPSRMLPIVRTMREAVDGFMATQPIGFRCWPEYTHLHGVPDWTQRVLAPSDMADYTREAIAMGINYIGSCCGSGPDQVRAMAEASGKKPRR
ncbi:homocysteine S-methyltransferase family protein [Candidatus Poribacteria bacterium]|nr:homocysteine S-methyltransferase family protein [Candidatus Poribacteria bacterium]